MTGLDDDCASISRSVGLRPVYNCAPYLDEALASALAQTFTDWEIVLVDDGSTDGNDVIAERFARNQPENARFMRPDGSNRGAGASRNPTLPLLIMTPL
jgi:CDP-glycerol glycerophosphotransferase